MNKDKSLTASIPVTLYQREKLVDKIQFLLPQRYEDTEIGNCIIILKYVDQGNVAHAEKLIAEDELYKERIRCVFPVDTNLTRFAGNIKMHLSFLQLNTDSGLHEEVFHSGEIIITINQLDDYFAFQSDESLDIIDRAMVELEAKLRATNAIAETYDAEKADNLVLGDSSIYLESNGKQIEKSVIQLNDLGDSLAENTDAGLTNVIIEDEIVVPGSDSEEDSKYTLKLDQEKDMLYLLCNGIVVSEIPTKDLGESIIDTTSGEGLVEVIT